MEFENRYNETSETGKKLLLDTEGKKLAMETVRCIEMEKISLRKQVEIGIISVADAAIYNDMNNKKLFKLQKQLVSTIHVMPQGKCRSIVYHEPTKSYNEGYWYTKLPGKKQVKAKTEQKLYEKLYEYYYGKPAFTVKDVFNRAIDEKECTENLKPQTVVRYRNNFKKYISKEFQLLDIVSITELQLKKYTQQLVTNKDVQLTKKQYLSYKSVLNIIFKYALQHGIIAENLVEKINNKAYLKSCDSSKAKSEEKIFSEEEIGLLVEEVRRRMSMSMRKWSEYYPLGFALIFSSLTGCRIGELCAIKWCDVDWSARLIHFHAQQIVVTVNGHARYAYDNHTKNEKGLSQEGRLFPLYGKVFDLLKEVKDKQSKLGIKSEYIFCLENGNWLTVHNYTKFLRRICTKVGLDVTNNHAFRMGLNSNVLIPCGLTAAERATLLGHSVETNLGYYSFARKDYLKNASILLDKIH